MDETICSQCGTADSTEGFTVDRFGVRHWFRRCSRCGHRWNVQHPDPVTDNPYARRGPPSWRPEPSPRYRY